MRSLEYHAGFFDGEGSVGLYASKTAQRFYLRACINQVESDASVSIFEELQSRFGGGIHHIKKTKPHHRQAMMWHLYGDEAITFLLAIRPFLHIKAHEVDLVVAWQQKYPPSPHYGRGVGGGRGRASIPNRENRAQDAREVMAKLDVLRSKGPARLRGRKEQESK